MRLTDRIRKREETLEEDEIAVEAIERKTETVEKRVYALETEVAVITRRLGGGHERSQPA